MEEGSGWWPVARTEELGGEQPIGVTCAGHAIALWREPDGTPRAVEDRCPHRRVPLSLGCVKADGRLRCGYHGWTFSGATGHLQEIPNLPDRDRFPPLYRVRTYPLREESGFVRVDLGGQARAIPACPDRLGLSGTVAVTIDHAEYIDALFDAPELLFTLPGVEMTTYLTSDPHMVGGRIVMERSCRWRGLHWPARVSADFPLNLWTATDIVTGETEIRLLDRSFRLMMLAVLAPVPARRSTTAVRWRARTGPGRRLMRRTPLIVNDAIDAARLVMTRPSASIELAKIRNGLRDGGRAAA